MRFSCTKENLAHSLSLITGIAGKNVNLPILGNILIKVMDQKVELVSTNLEMAIIANLRAKVEAIGSFTVPAKTLSDFINLLPEEKIDMELAENELVIVCGSSATKIKGAPAEEFPIIPSVEDGEGFLVVAEDLKSSLSQVLPAVAKNNIRPELSGMFLGFNLQGKPELTLAATDSYRLAEKKITVEQGQKEVKTILPGRTAQEIWRVLSLSTGVDKEKHARVLLSDNQLVFRYDDFQMISRLVDGQYPDYTQIIPKETKTEAEILVREVVKEVKAASLFSASGVNAVSVDLNVAQGTVGISSTSTQTGEYVSEVKGEIKGEENSVLLNFRYLLDGLNSMVSERAILKMVGKDSPCLLTPKSDEKFLYIIMPIRQ